MKEFSKGFRILDYPAVYYFYESRWVDYSHGFIYIRWSGCPEDFDIFTNFRDAFKAVIEYGL